jgi:hypothetical protein
MIDFQRPTLSHRQHFEPLLHKSGHRSCEYSFANLLTWAEAYDERIAEVDGFAVVWVGGEGGNYLWPSGEGDLCALLPKLWADARQRGNPFTLVGLSREQRDWLEETYPGAFSYENPEGAADYCYRVEKLATLSGKKLHAKRNHIHRFEEHYPNWHTEPLTAANEGDCYTIARDWERATAEAGQEDWNSDQGEEALRMTMEHREELGMDGMVLYDGGSTDEAGNPLPDRAIAFCMGQRLGGDTYDVLFEKAYGDVQGAYAMINREFARWVGVTYPEVVYLNREDDLEEPNLRKAKRSYYPDLMVEKWNAQLLPGQTLEVKA